MTNRRRFAAFDIDGTLFRDGLYRAMAWELMERGVVPDVWVTRITQAYQNGQWRSHPTAYDDYEAALIAMFRDILPNIPTVAFDTAAMKIAAEQLEHVYTYTRSELQRLKRAGYFLIAISGSHQEVVQPFAEKYQFDAWLGQTYVREGERFTGEIIATYTAKDVLLQQLIDRHQLTLEDSYAFGDSYGDRGLLETVEHPVAFNPTTELLELAMERGWKVVVERKSIIYELEKGGDAYLLARAGKV